VSALFQIGLTVVLAAAFGFAIYRAVILRIRRRWLRVALSIISGGSAFVVAAGYLLYVALSTPAVDSPEFKHEESLAILLTVGDTQRARVTLAVPRSVRANEDCSVFLEVEGHLPPGDYAATLIGPQDVELRTLDSCSDAPAAPGRSSTRAACGHLRAGAKLRLTWDVSPTGAGAKLLTLQLPTSIEPSPAEPWYATLERNGRPVTREDVQAWERIPDRYRTHAVPEVPVRLSPTEALYREGSTYVDLANFQLRSTVDVATTLGVDASTYSFLAILGTIFSGLLGGGWIWQAVEWWRKRAQYTAEKPQQSV